MTRLIAVRSSEKGEGPDSPVFERRRKDPLRALCEARASRLARVPRRRRRCRPRPKPARPSTRRTLGTAGPFARGRPRRRGRTRAARSHVSRELGPASVGLGAGRRSVGVGVAVVARASHCASHACSPHPRASSDTPGLSARAIRRISPRSCSIGTRTPAALAARSTRPYAMLPETASDEGRARGRPTTGDASALIFHRTPIGAPTRVSCRASRSAENASIDGPLINGSRSMKCGWTSLTTCTASVATRTRRGSSSGSSDASLAARRATCRRSGSTARRAPSPDRCSSPRGACRCEALATGVSVRSRGAAFGVRRGRG